MSQSPVNCRPSYARERGRGLIALCMPQASVMIAVLWAVVIGALMLSLLYRQQRLLATISSTSLEKVQARWAARAGVEQAIAVLDNDLTVEDSQWDDWYEDEMAFAEVNLSDRLRFSVYSTDVSNGTSTIRFGLTDEASKLNLNEAHEDDLYRLGLSETHIAAIKDWVDRDNQARGMGAEQSYYNAYYQPYDVRQGPMTTIRELGLVRHDDTLWKELLPYVCVHSYEVNEREEDLDMDAVFDSFLDFDAEDDELSDEDLNAMNEDTLAGDSKRYNLKKMSEKEYVNTFYFTKSLAKTIRERAQKSKTLFDLVDFDYESSGGAQESQDEQENVSVLDINWMAQNIADIALDDADKFYGKVNLNTASPEVLLALPEMTEIDVDAIVNYRDSGLGPFVHVGDLYLEGVISDPQVFAAIAERLTVKSNVFRFTSRGETAGGVVHEIEVVVDRGQDGMPILHWYEKE